MLNADDLAFMRAMLQKSLADFYRDVVIIRDGKKLNPQKIYVSSVSNPSVTAVLMVQTTKVQYRFSGPLELDIKVNDRFALDGTQYHVTALDPANEFETAGWLEAQE